MTNRKADVPGTRMLRADAWNRVQDQFLARAQTAVERARREGSGISPDELLRRMDDRIDTAQKLLSERHGMPEKPGPAA